MALIFEHIVTEGLGDISYLIGDDTKGVAAVIDPRADVAIYLQLARKHKVAITHIFQTHIHEDFMSGASVLAAMVGNARLYSSEEGGASYGYSHVAVMDGAVFEFGDTVLTARHTPGHTPEHMAYLVAEADRAESPYAVFSGGSLLINAAGRTDLLGPEEAQALTAAQYRTLYDFYLKLEDHVIIHPTHGHGSPCGASIGDRLSSTIGYERRFNPFLQRKSAEDFHEFALNGLPPKPSYYPRLKEVNTSGPEVLRSLPVVPPLPPEAFRNAIVRNDAVVVDTRHMLAFGGGHIDGALNIGGTHLMPIWAGWTLDASQPILLVLDSDTSLHTVVSYLMRTGFTRFAGYLVGGMSAWDNAGFPTVATAQKTVEEIHGDRSGMTLIDVRSPAEWKLAHIPGAIHIFLPSLAQQIKDIPADRPVAVYCGTGYRASLGASILQRAGLKNVSNIPGSIQAWKRAGYEVAR